MLSSLWPEEYYKLVSLQKYDFLYVKFLLWKGHLLKKYKDDLGTPNGQMCCLLYQSHKGNFFFCFPRFKIWLKMMKW